MEKEGMEMTPQDIIDKEFRVKFRGFDMAEVDAFLEELAENFFKLTEENTLLHEKISALRRDLGAARTSAAAPVELSPELGAILEDLKQDTEAIGAELASLRQDRQTLDSLRKSLEEIALSMQESGSTAAAGQVGLPPDLADTLEEIKKGSAALNAELAALKGDRQSFAALKKHLEDALAAAQQALPNSASQGQVEIPASLGKTLEDFKKGSEAVGTELAALKQEVAALSGVRAEIKSELQDMLSSHFATLETKLSAMSGTAFRPGAEAKAAPEKKERLPAARIVEQYEDIEEDTRVSEYEEQEDADDDSSLQFLSEDDILDVDKLRDMFQAVLDDTITDGPSGRHGEDSSADLLFFDEAFTEDQHEPQVTFSLDQNKNDTKPKAK
jgi:cell division initiation protein